jgi:hypothetical protein
MVDTNAGLSINMFQKPCCSKAGQDLSFRSHENKKARNIKKVQIKVDPGKTFF